MNEIIRRIGGVLALLIGGAILWMATYSMFFGPQESIGGGKKKFVGIYVLGFVFLYLGYHMVLGKPIFVDDKPTEKSPYAEDIPSVKPIKSNEERVDRSDSN